MKKLLVLLVIIVALSGCLEDKSIVSPDNLYLELKAQYVATAEETYVRAVFHKEKLTGPIVEIRGDASIMVNDQEMTITNPLIGGYNQALTGYVDSLMVSYSDENGNIYEYPIDMEQAPYISIPSTIDTLNIQQDHELFWNGPAIELPTERVILEYGVSGSNNYSAVNDEVDGTSLTIPSRNLMAFGVGEIDMFLTRSVFQELDNAPPKGGTVSIEYSTGRVPVSLIYQ